MKKIKIIDLLNMIVNGEEVPKKIKHNNYIYELKSIYDGGRTTYYDESDNDFFSEVYCDMQNLNEEIEIIEDKPKEIKKIEFNAQNDIIDEEDDDWEYNTNDIDIYIAKKINEIIDVLNELKKEK